jgi:hypothetical protein
LVLAEDDGQLEIELGKSRVSAMSAPHEAKQLHRWHALQEFAELFSVALSRHRMGVIVETTLRELEGAFERNLNRFLVLARPGLDVTFAPHDQTSIAVPANATVLTPTCIELGSHVYYAIVKIPSKDIIPNDDGSFRVIGDRPTVVADGLLDLASLNITDLNQRAANFARHENGFVIVTSLTNPDKLSEKT